MAALNIPERERERIRRRARERNDPRERLSDAGARA
jgi:hypothetical protein